MATGSLVRNTVVGFREMSGLPYTFVNFTADKSFRPQNKRVKEPETPLSSEKGTTEPVKGRFWPWLAIFQVNGFDRLRLR